MSKQTGIAQSSGTNTDESRHDITPTTPKSKNVNFASRDPTQNTNLQAGMSNTATSLNARQSSMRSSSAVNAESKRSRRRSHHSKRSSSSSNSRSSNQTLRSSSSLTDSPRRSRSKYPKVNRAGTLDKLIRKCLGQCGTFRHNLGLRRRPPVSDGTLHFLSDSAFVIQSIILKRFARKMRKEKYKKISLDRALNFLELIGSHQNVVDQAMARARLQQEAKSRLQKSLQSSEGGMSRTPRLRDSRGRYLSQTSMNSLPGTPQDAIDTPLNKRRSSRYGKQEKSGSRLYSKTGIAKNQLQNMQTLDERGSSSDKGTRGLPIAPRKPKAFSKRMNKNSRARKYSGSESENELDENTKTSTRSRRTRKKRHSQKSYKSSSDEENDKPQKYSSSRMNQDYSADDEDSAPNRASRQTLRSSKGGSMIPQQLLDAGNSSTLFPPQGSSARMFEQQNLSPGFTSQNASNVSFMSQNGSTNQFPARNLSNTFGESSQNNFNNPASGLYRNQASDGRQKNSKRNYLNSRKSSHDDLIREESVPYQIKSQLSIPIIRDSSILRSQSLNNQRSMNRSMIAQNQNSPRDSGGYKAMFRAGSNVGTPNQAFPEPMQKLPLREESKLSMSNITSPTSATSIRSPGGRVLQDSNMNSSYGKRSY